MAFNLKDLSSADLDELERYVRRVKRLKDIETAWVEKDFFKFAKNALGWTMDLIEDAWAWLRKKLGI